MGWPRVKLGCVGLGRFWVEFFSVGYVRQWVLILRISPMYLIISYRKAKLFCRLVHYSYGWPKLFFDIWGSVGYELGWI